jgi:hypothetical protein
MGEMSRRDLLSILDNSTLVIQVKDAGGRYVRIKIADLKGRSVPRQ